MKILVVEDEALFLDTVLIILEEMGYEKLYSADSSHSALELFVAVKPDLVLMDINIKGEQDGIKVAETISKSENAVPIIFMTSLEDKKTFERAKKTNPINYLVKPFEDDDLKRSIELAVYKYHHATWDSDFFTVWQEDILAKDSFFVKQDKKLTRVLVQDIIHIQAVDKYIELLLDKKKMLARMSLSELNNKLPPDVFARVSKSFIINVTFISDIDLVDSTITLKNGEVVKVSRHYKDNILKRLNIIQ